MKIYVASKFENSAAVREAHRVLKLDGHLITHDWTYEDASGLTEEAREIYLKECAEKDLYGVLHADAVLLINYERCVGAYTELGIAIGTNKFTVVIDGHHPDKPNNIFFHLKQVRHAKDLEDARTLFQLHELAHKGSSR